MAPRNQIRRLSHARAARPRRGEIAQLDPQISGDRQGPQAARSAPGLSRRRARGVGPEGITSFSICSSLRTASMRRSRLLSSPPRRRGFSAAAIRRAPGAARSLAVQREFTAAITTAGTAAHSLKRPAPFRSRASSPNAPMQRRIRGGRLDRAGRPSALSRCPAAGLLRFQWKAYLCRPGRHRHE
jgi:hypothetical protein